MTRPRSRMLHTLLVRLQMLLAAPPTARPIR